jgi:hypothetical protein
MKKLIATCTLAVGVMAASNSFGALSIPTTTGPIFNVNLSGTATYDTVQPASITYKGVTTTVAPTLLTIKWAVPDLIKLLNKSYVATNLLIDVTGGAYTSFPLDAYLVFTPYSEFGTNATDYYAGHLALVDNSGFYFPLEGSDSTPNYLSENDGDPSYAIADLYFFDAVGNSAIDQTSLAGSETDMFSWEFYFDDLNYRDSKGNFNDWYGVSLVNKETSFAVNGWGSESLTSSSIGTGTVTTVAISGSGKGNSAAWELSDLLIAPQVYDLHYYGGNAQISAALGLSGGSTEDTEVSDFFPWEPAWYFSHNY